MGYLFIRGSESIEVNIDHERTPNKLKVPIVVHGSGTLIFTSKWG